MGGHKRVTEEWMLTSCSLRFDPVQALWLKPVLSAAGKGEGYRARGKEGGPGHSTASYHTDRAAWGEKWEGDSSEVKGGTPSLWRIMCGRPDL